MTFYMCLQKCNRIFASFISCFKVESLDDSGGDAACELNITARYATRTSDQHANIHNETFGNGAAPEKAQPRNVSGED